MTEINYFDKYVEEATTSLYEDANVKVLMESLDYKNKLKECLQKHLTHDEIKESYKANFKELSEEEINDLASRVGDKFTKVSDEMQEMVMACFSDEDKEIVEVSEEDFKNVCKEYKHEFSDDYKVVGSERMTEEMRNKARSLETKEKIFVEKKDG